MWSKKNPRSKSEGDELTKGPVMNRPLFSAQLHLPPKLWLYRLPPP